MSRIIVPTKYDRRRKYYMVLDCETATLPIVSTLPSDRRKDVAIAKPLIYDLGWQIVDKKGIVYSRRNFLITEIFSVPEIFDTAYYASKKPIYLDKLAKGEIILTDWRTAVAEMVEDMNHVEAVGAYNAMFDFKKAIPFTESYIKNLYSPNYYRWILWQNHCCEEIARGIKSVSKVPFEEDVFRFRGQTYPLFDLWGLSCRYLLDNDEYKTACIKGGWSTASGKYFKTSAETAFRFVSGELAFDEAHTAVDDAEIESVLFAMIVKNNKNKVEIGITFFPFRILGTVNNFLAVHPELRSD